MQCTCDYAYSLELSARVTDAVFVDGECLSEELVGEFLEAALVGYLSARHEESKTELCCGRGDAGVELRQRLMHEPVQGRGLRGPIVVKVFSRFELASKFHGGSDKGGSGVTYTLVASFVGFACFLKEFELCVVVWAFDEVDYSREPALFFNYFVRFAISLAIGKTRVTTWLLHALFDDYAK